jgi:hypothetical protein
MKYLYTYCNSIDKLVKIDLFGDGICSYRKDVSDKNIEKKIM